MIGKFRKEEIESARKKSCEDKRDRKLLAEGLVAFSVLCFYLVFGYRENWSREKRLLGSFFFSLCCYQVDLVSCFYQEWRKLLSEFLLCLIFLGKSNWVNDARKKKLKRKLLLSLLMNIFFSPYLVNLFPCIAMQHIGGVCSLKEGTQSWFIPVVGIIVDFVFGYISQHLFVFCFLCPFFFLRVLCFIIYGSLLMVDTIVIIKFVML